MLHLAFLFAAAVLLTYGGFVVFLCVAGLFDALHEKQ